MMYDEDMADIPDEEEKGSGDEEEEETAENTYYNAKGVVEENPKEALTLLAKVLELEKQEGPKGEWGFKALKKLCKINFQQKNYAKVHDHFKTLLTYVKSAVSANLSEKALNSILDLIGTSGDFAFMARMYESASTVLLETKNTRLWFRVNLKLAQILFDTQGYEKLRGVLSSLHQWCEEKPGVDDPKKGSQLMDVYALEIQLNTALRDTKVLKEIHARASLIKSAIPHPRVLGIIRECGGMVNMEEHEWLAAKQDFFEAFKNFDEAGSPKRIQCLKYLIFASMLDLSTINPFESPETKPYKNDAKIATFQTMHQVFEKGDIKKFEKLLQESGAELKDDPFMSKFIPDLLRIYRSHVLLRVLRPYRRVRISFLSQELGVTDDICEDLLVTLILDNRLRAHIDQINKFLVLATATSEAERKYVSLSKWSQQISTMVQAMPNKLPILGY
jgi:COP9 signalosome complex subunit 2